MLFGTLSFPLCGSNLPNNRQMCGFFVVAEKESATYQRDYNIMLRTTHAQSMIIIIISLSRSAFYISMPSSTPLLIHMAHLNRSE